MNTLKIWFLLGQFSLILVSCVTPQTTTTDTNILPQNFGVNENSKVYPLENNEIDSTKLSVYNQKGDSGVDLQKVQRKSVLNQDSIGDIIGYRAFFKDSNLVALIDTALNNNFDIRMAYQRLTVAKNEYRFAQQSLFPTLQGNTFFQQRKFGYYTMDDAGNRVTEFYPGKLIPTHLPDYYGGFQTNWELDVWGKLRNKKRAAFHRQLSSLDGQQLLKISLIDQIATAYYELLSLDLELELVRRFIELQKNALDALLVQKEAGRENELSVKQFRALVLNSQSFEVSCLQEIQLKENAINLLLGRMPQTILRNHQYFHRDSFVLSKYGVPSELLNNRPDIRSAENELMASKFDVLAAKAAFYPTFNIFGTIGLQSFSTNFLFNFPKSMAYNFLGNVAGPLINRAAIKLQFSNAKANQFESLLKYQKTVLGAYVEVVSELTTLNHLTEKEQLKKQETEELDRSISIAYELFLTGKASYLEVLNAQRTALQSNIELIELRKQKFITNIHLYKSIGGGWK